MAPGLSVLPIVPWAGGYTIAWSGNLSRVWLAHPAQADLSSVAGVRAVAAPLAWWQRTPRATERRSSAAAAAPTDL